MDPISGKAIASASPPGAGALEGAGGPEKTGGRSFQDVMESAKAQGPSGTQGPEGTGQVEPTQGVQATAEAQPVEPAARRLDEFFKSVSADQKAMDRAMEKAMRGDAMDGQELLQLQATMYGYAQKIDLSTKIVEKTTGGLKQMMNTQV